jgi:hypothetical protein
MDQFELTASRNRFLSKKNYFQTYLFQIYWGFSGNEERPNWDGGWASGFVSLRDQAVRGSGFGCGYGVVEIGFSVESFKSNASTLRCSCGWGKLIVFMGELCHISIAIGIRIDALGPMPNLWIS